MNTAINFFRIHLFIFCIISLSSCGSDDSDSGSDDDSVTSQRSAAYNIIVNGNGLSNATVEGAVLDDATSFYLDDLDPDNLNFTMSDQDNNVTIAAGFAIVDEVIQEYPFMETTNEREVNLLISTEFSGTTYTFVSESIGSATITDVMLEEVITEDGFLVRELQVLFAGEFINTQDSNTYNISGSFSFLDE